jgi:hypothetical protein
VPNIVISDKAFKTFCPDLYSKSTIRTYDNEFRQFLQTIKDKPANSFKVSSLMPKRRLGAIMQRTMANKSK